MSFLLNSNDFLATLTNLCLQVNTFNQLTFSGKFNAFRRKYTTFGDKIASVVAFVSAGDNYGAKNNPFDANKPTAFESTIKTTLKKTYSLQLSNELLQGAFEDNNSLGMFLDVLTKQLVTLSEIDIYEQVITDISNINDFLTEFMAQSLTKPSKSLVDSGALTKENATEVYRKILQVANEFTIPNNNYGIPADNAGRKLACAEGQKLCLYLTPEAKALFDVYVNASLFNSSEIELAKTISVIEVVDLPDTVTYANASGTATETSGIYAMLCTDDIYRTSPRIQQMEPVVRNSANMSQNYWYHVWTNTGFTGAGQIAFFHE